MSTPRKIPRRLGQPGLAGGDVAGILREAVVRGDLPKSTKPDVLAGFVLNGWEGALLRCLAYKSCEPLEVFLLFAFEKVLVGVNEIRP